MTTTYCYDQQTGIFIGTSDADESPLELGVFLIPANATLTPPIPCGDGQRQIFSNGAWTVEDIPIPENPPASTNAELRVAELKALFATYQSDMQTLQSAWVSALITGGVSEDSRKTDVASDINDVNVQYASDVTAVKLKYPL